MRALAEGAEALVRKVWPNAIVEFQNFGRGAAPVAIRERTLLKEQFNRKSELREWASGYDLAVDMRWGDSFSDIYGLRRLAGMSALAQIVTNCGVPLVMGPQTIGPFKTKAGEWIARRALQDAAGIATRDDLSAQCSSALGVGGAVVGTDVVFAIPKPLATQSNDIAMNVSGLLWEPNPHVDHMLYRSSVKSICESLVAQGRRVTLFAHVLDSDKADNDVPAIRSAKSSISVEVDTFFPGSLSELRGFVAGSNLVIGARMHACLNALSVGTPAIAMAYSRKFEPLLSRIGWHRTVDLRGSEAVDTKTLELFDQLALLSQEVGEISDTVQGLLSIAANELERSAAEWRKR
ncbi:polysaccharide pyruvyl transferase family protein [Rhodococcus sp. SJ-2]